jgi:hypothetical protein
MFLFRIFEGKVPAMIISDTARPVLYRHDEDVGSCWFSRLTLYSA